jgi:hypothetical protein
VVQLHRAIDDIHAAGAELYVIGNGAPMFIDGFRETTGFSGAVYTDPSLAAYKAAHLERGFFKTVSLGGALASVGALRRGFRQGKTMGDATQQGGVVVVARDGSEIFHHISKHPGDNAPPEDIVRALRERQ